jgi:hypothetical protein
MRIGSDHQCTCATDLGDIAEIDGVFYVKIGQDTWQMLGEAQSPADYWPTEAHQPRTIYNPTVYVTLPRVAA